MLASLEFIEKQVSRIDQQLLLHLIKEQQETNRLLRMLTEDKTEDKKSLNQLKRPELMKLMSKETNAPQGWNRWDTEKIRQYLKEAG